MVCFAFIFGQLLTFIRYIEVYFTFAFLNCVRYNEDFVKSRFVTSRFCSIHFVVILAWLKKIFCYAEDFVMQNRLVRRPVTPVTVLRAARYRSMSRSLFRILPGEVHLKKHLNIVGSQKNFLLKPPTTWISLIGWCFGLNRFSHVALVLWQRKMIFHQLIYKVTHAWANM